MSLSAGSFPWDLSSLILSSLKILYSFFLIFLLFGWWTSIFWFSYSLFSFLLFCSIFPGHILNFIKHCSVQFSSITQLNPTLCHPMDCSKPGSLVHHQLPELAQTHVHRVGDAIQPSHPVSSPSPPAFNLSQHQGLFQWIGSSHQVAKVLEFQVQNQYFQWIFRTDFL